MTNLIKRTKRASEEIMHDKLHLPDVINSAVYNAGDRVELIDSGDKGTVWITNGRWLNVKLDKGITWKGETDQIKHCL